MAVQNSLVKAEQKKNEVTFVAIHAIQRSRR